jgi:hypothetical protein
MGYSIKIGNAKPVFSKKYDELYAAWEVEPVCSDKAPIFPNDPSKNYNERSPCYSVWSDFLEWCSLKSLFYEYKDSLMGYRADGGCTLIKESDHSEIKDALEKKKKLGIGEPGFDGEYNIDQANLARLIWLEFWTRWALDNAETPAIEYG